MIGMGLEIVRYTNNRGAWNNRGGEGLGKLKIVFFLS